MALTSFPREVWSGRVAVIVVLVCSSAGARTAAKDTNDDRAQQLFSSGVDAARRDEWIDARGAFERAYRLAPKLVVLINLAGAQARTGLLVEALHNYQRVMESSTSPDTAEYREAARAILPSLEARIPRVRVSPAGLGPSDAVEIDGTEVPPSALERPVLVNPGAHALTIKRDHVQRARIEFSVAEGESHDITLPAPVFTLSPPPPTPRGVDVTTSPAPDGSSQPRRRRWWTSPWFWAATVGVVAASTAAAVVLVEQRPQPYSGNVGPGIVNVP